MNYVPDYGRRLFSISRRWLGDRRLWYVETPSREYDGEEKKMNGNNNISIIMSSSSSLTPVHVTKLTNYLSIPKCLSFLSFF